MLLPQNPGGLPLAEFVFSASAATNPANGQVTIALAVPSNQIPALGYQGLNPLANGRFINNATFFFGAPAAGDKITSIVVIDEGGVMPSGDQAGFPSYPILTSLLDPFMDAGNQQLFINQNFTVNPGGQVFLPSGLFVVVTAVAANNRADTLYANVGWSMLIPQ